MRRKLFLSVTLLTILFTPAIASAQQQEEIILSTYYPAPYGEYDELTAYWIDVDDTAAPAVDDEDGRDIAIRAQQGGAAFTVNPDGGDIILIPGDKDAGSTGRDGGVGIGTTNPTAKLEVQGGAIKATGGLILHTVASSAAEATMTKVDGQIWLRTDINP